MEDKQYHSAPALESTQNNEKMNFPTLIELEEGLALLPQFSKRGGMLPVAVQESSTGQILMLATVNEEALRKTLRTQLATFWSTSRSALWTKGETSGNQLKIDRILIDCDQDALVYQVTLMGGGVCHTYDAEGNNRKACFYREVNIKQRNLVFLKDF
jgi:phosphoribosyl-AMP cyclohydrolase